MAVVVSLCVALAPLSASDPKKGEPGPLTVNVSVQTPKPGTKRKLTPEEVKAAYEKAQAARQQDSSAASSLATPMAAPAPSAGSLSGPVPVPAPLVLYSPKETRVALPAISVPLGRVGDRDPNAPPGWTPIWQRTPLGAGERSSQAAIVIDYEWRGLNAAVTLTPENGKGEPLRFLFNRQGPVKLEVEPGSYRLEVEAWRPADAARAKMYSFPGQQFQRGSLHRLVMDAAVGDEVHARIGEQHNRLSENFATPKPKTVSY